MTNFKNHILQMEISQDYAGQTLEHFLRNGLQLSRSRIRALKQSEGILLNDQLTYVTHRLRGGELLSLVMNPLAQNISSEDLALAIIYEDQDLIVVNKPAGMVVHPVKKHQSGTLANGLVYHWQKSGEVVSFHPVHRLDRLTTGLVLIAKNAWAHQQLSLQIDSGKLHRFYLAVCCGRPNSYSGKIDAPIKDNPDSPKREIQADGRRAITRYRVLRYLPGYTLLAIKLFTGRTHQIRVHLAHIGHPLYGDPLYGEPVPEFSRPALHAVRLAFIHPRTGMRLICEAPLSEDIRNRFPAI